MARPSGDTPLKKMKNWRHISIQYRDAAGLTTKKNRSSAVAEMGDRLATTDMGRNRHGPKSGSAAAVPFFVEESWVPHPTQRSMV